MSDTFTNEEDKYCPNCGKLHKADLAYCPHCGFEPKRIHFASDPIDVDLPQSKPLPFSGLLVLGLLFLLPLAAFGGCIAGFSLEGPNSSGIGIGFALACVVVELASVAIGLIMLFANAFTALFRKK